MKSLIVVIALFTVTPAMAVELYHCTVNNVTDGYFNSIDLKVDGQIISGETMVNGAEVQINSATASAWQYEEYDGKIYTVIDYAGSNGLTENIYFSLSDVTGKLGGAVRSEVTQDSNEVYTDVQMICEMATPI